jgi:hypothetical protein
VLPRPGGSVYNLRTQHGHFYCALPTKRPSMSDVVRRVLRDGSFRQCAEAYAGKRTMRGVEYAKECRYVRHWICKAAAEIVWRRICKVVQVSGRDAWRWGVVLVVGCRGLDF